MANKRLLLRRGTVSQHSNFTGEVGEITYVTDGTPQLRIHDGSTPGGISLTSGVSEIGALSDVTLTSLSPGDVLSWDDVSSEWINSPAASTDKIEEGNTFVETVDTGTDGHIKLQTEGFERWHVTSGGHFIPQSNGSYDIGSAEKKVRHLFLSDNSLQFGSDSDNSISGTLSVTGTADLQWNGATIFTGNLPQASDSVPGIIEIADQTEADAGADIPKAMTPALVKRRIDAAIVGGVEYKGTFDASNPTDLADAKKGDLYIISGAGTYPPASSLVWAINDHLLINDDMSGSISASKIDKIDNTDEVGILSVNGDTSSAVSIGLDSVLSVNNISANSIELTDGTDTTVITHQQLITGKVQRSSGNLELEGSTGVVEILGDGTSLEGAIKLNCHVNSHGVTIKSPHHSAEANYTLTLPTTNGNADQVLTTDGTGLLSWTTPATPSSQNFYTTQASASGTSTANPQVLGPISDNRRQHYNLVSSGETYQIPDASDSSCIGGIVSIRNGTSTNIDVKLPVTYPLDGSATASGDITTLAGREHRAYVWATSSSLYEIGTRAGAANLFGYESVDRSTTSTDLPIQSTENENMNLFVNLTGTGANVNLRDAISNKGAVLIVKSNTADFNLVATTNSVIRLINGASIAPNNSLVVKQHQVMSFVSDGLGRWHQMSAEENDLESLVDVNISTPSVGEALIYDGTDWTNGSPAGKTVINQYNVTSVAAAVSTQDLHVYRLYGSSASQQLTVSSQAGGTGAAVVINNISTEDWDITGPTFRKNGEGASGGLTSIIVKAGERRSFYIESASLWLETTATYLGRLADVVLTNPSGTNVLKYNATSGDWENGAVNYSEISGAPAVVPNFETITVNTDTTLSSSLEDGCYLIVLTGVATVTIPAYATGKNLVFRFANFGVPACTIQQASGGNRLYEFGNYGVSGVNSVSLSIGQTRTFHLHASGSTVATNNWTEANPATSGGGGGGSVPTVFTTGTGNNQISATTSPVSLQAATGIEEIYLLNPTNNQTITLQSATVVSPGYKYNIKNLSTNTLTISTSGSEYIDISGQTTLALNVQYSSVTLVSDGSNWFII